MKRLLAIALSIIMVLSLAACGDEEKAEKYCSNCGGGILKSAAYCEHCGAEVGTTQSTNNDTSSDNTFSSESSENSSSNVDSTETQSKPAEETVSKPATTEKPTGQAHTHSYTSKTTAPTCTKQGYTTYTCSCGDSYKDHYVNTIAHSYSKVVTKATCTKQGYTTYTCSCGDTYKDNYTNASHSYSKYKCTSCGAVDKSHAYEYLMIWVKENGTTNGGYTEIIYEEDEDKYSLAYSAQYNTLSVYKSGSYSGNFTFTYLNLEESFYRNDFGEITMEGYIKPSTFTTNTALSYTSYDGSSSVLNSVLELSRYNVCDLVKWLDWCLDTYDIGITIKDLGFTSY